MWENPIMEGVGPCVVCVLGGGGGIHYRCSSEILGRRRMETMSAHSTYKPTNNHYANLIQSTNSQA